MRDTLDAGNFKGLKTAIWASSGPIALLGRFREKTRSSFAVCGSISPRRRVTDLEFPEPIPAPEGSGRFGNLGF